jgi:hypothetical protein
MIDPYGSYDRIWFELLYAYMIFLLYICAEEREIYQQVI